MLLYCFLQYTMHTRGENGKLTEVNLGQHFPNCLGELAHFTLLAVNICILLALCTTYPSASLTSESWTEIF